MKVKVRNIFFVLSSAVLLSGCVNKTAMVRTIRFNKENDDSFSITTNLNEVKEIHTDRQKAYLEYDGNYATIPEANYPDGQQHLSDPLAINLAWNFTIPSGKTLSRYDVVVGKEADLSDGYTIKGTTAQSIDVYNSYLGDNYFKVVANYSDSTKDSSPIQKYTVDDVYPRNIRIEGMTNCRDMGGGRELEDGGYIKQGLIYRTSSTSQWAYGRGAVADTITDAGKEELLNRLGCKTEINVNNSGSNTVDVSNYVQAYMYYDGGKHHLYRNAEPIKEVFHALSDINNYPVFYHCRIGTDRTGLCAILISGLLGVSENEIYQDYLFSNFGNIQEKRYIGDKAGRDNILNYIQDLKAMPGEKFHNKVYNYLLSIGVPAQELDSVINILTEGTKAAGNDHYQTVITANEFESDDLQAKTSTTHAHPSKYYTLQANKSITCSFRSPYRGEAKLYAYLGSTDNSSSKKISDSLEVEYDQDEMEVEETTFADAGFGQGDGRTYYAAILLGTVSVAAGYQEMIITGKANDLNIGAVSIIPGDNIHIKDDEPAEEPGGSSSSAPSSQQPASSSPSSSSEQPAASSDQSASSDKSEQPSSDTRRRGCGGSIVASASIASLVAIAGIAVMAFKKRKEK